MSRDIWKIVFQNFIKSLRPRRFSGDFMGADNFGNKYYEIPADPSIGKRKNTRWFEPPKKDDFMNEMAPEWEAWLRGRRTQAPSNEEVMRNYALMQMKKQNAIEVDAKGGKMKPLEKGMETFPKHGDYELMPGKKQDEK